MRKTRNCTESTTVVIEFCARADCSAGLGSRLCPLCRERLSLDLGRLPRLHEACGRLLSGGAPDRSSPRTSGGPLPSMPFNTPAAEARSSILGVLGSWAGAVVEQRGVSAPHRTAASLAVFLERHLDWLAEHPAAGELCEEVAQLVRRAGRVVDPEEHRLVPVGTCVEQGCQGLLTAVVRPQYPRHATVIRCDRGPAHRWSGPEWLELSRRMGAAPTGAGPAAEPGAEPGAEEGGTGAEAPVRWVTAPDVAHLWGISTGSVYRHASESKWRRRSHQGRTHYHGGDVTQTLDGRTRSSA